jgi:hypothetical protein
MTDHWTPPLTFDYTAAAIGQTSGRHHAFREELHPIGTASGEELPVLFIVGEPTSVDVSQFGGETSSANYLLLAVLAAAALFLLPALALGVRRK